MIASIRARRLASFFSAMFFALYFLIVSLVRFALFVYLRILFVMI